MPKRKPTDVELLDDLAEEEAREAYEEAFQPADLPLVETWKSVQDTMGFDLRGVDTSLPPEWVPGAEGIIRKRERALWNAKQGNGKTQAALHLAAQVTAEGGRVLYLDVENDRVEMARRMQPIMDGLNGSWERLAYLPDFPIVKVHGNEDLMAVWAQTLKASDLLIIDSFTRMLRICGKDENDNAQVTDWMIEYVDPIAKAGEGIAVLILDNTGHEGTRSRGAISKEATVETVYNVSGGKGVKPNKTGTLELKLTRSRSGELADRVTARSGGGAPTPLVAQEDSNDSGTKERVAEERRNKLAQALRDDPDLVLNVTAGTRITGASRNTAKADLEALVADGRAVAVDEGWKLGRV